MGRHVRIPEHLAGPLLERKDGNEPRDVKVTPEVKKLFDDLQTGFKEFCTKNNQRLDQLEKRGTSDVITKEEVDRINKHLDTLQSSLDQATLEAKRPVLKGFDGQERELTADEVEHRKAFNDFFTKGRDNGLREIEKKALSAGSDPDGGYTVPVSVETNIMRVVTDISPVRSVAQVMSIGTNQHKKPINQGGATSGWVGETSSRPQTNTPVLNELVFPVHEMYAMPGATQTLLDDSAINIEQWLADEVRITFAQQEGAAFVNGDGVSKPRGFLQYPKVLNASYSWGNVGVTITGTANDFTADPDGVDDFIDLITSLHPTYRGNARFAMNRATQGRIRKMRDGDDNYIWQPSVQLGQPASLLGYAITEMEDMPDVGDAAHPVAFADFRSAYLVVDRIGIRVLRDPYSSKPYVLFYTTKRVGGGIQNFEAIKLLRTDDS